jgi:hypothetical protein
MSLVEIVSDIGETIDLDFAVDSNYSYYYTYVCSPFHTKNSFILPSSHRDKFCDFFFNFFCPNNRADEVKKIMGEDF